MEIRRMAPGDERTVWDVYYASTHRVVARDYTLEQVTRWAPHDYDEARWGERLHGQHGFVAEIEGQVVGFATLKGAEADLFYCHPDHQRVGIGHALMQAVFDEAVRLGFDRLTAGVSATAVDFFQAMGFKVAEETNHPVCGVPAKQSRMSKRLDRA